MKFLTIVILFSLFSALTFGQVTDAEKTLRSQTADTTLGWRTGGVFAVNLAQTSLTNWAAGGQNSVATNGIFSVFANYKQKRSVWVNSLDIGYGLLKQGKGTGFRKTDDKFDFLSKYGQEAFKNVYYAALFNFKTQMAPGINYADGAVKMSDFLAPAYALVALGMDYKPSANLSAFIAPVTGKIIIVNSKLLSDEGAFGVDSGKNAKFEFGGYIRVIYTRNDFKSAFLKNVSFTTKVDLFSNYLDKPQNIVVNWETLLAFKVNKFISANIITQLIYDDKIKVPFDKNKDGIIESGEAVESKIQFKEILGVGLSYNF